jgi:asparagine synthase (glutamine-hydrolysing)
MSALCGWIGLTHYDRPAAVGLRAMVDAYRGRRQSEASIIGRQASIWAAADRSSGVVSEAGEILAGIVGQPRWRDPVLVDEQRQRGHAAALVRAYRAHDVGLLGKIGGSFAFAILDQAAGKALLAVDRMGIHSLYFSTPRGSLVFGSTADLVRFHPDVRTSIPLQAIYNYLHAYVCRSPGTIYAEQRKLGPGHLLKWENGEERVESYWRMPFEPDRSKSEDELAEELVEQLRQAVRRSLPEGRSEGVGAFLSGGLDSSTVTGMLSEVSAMPTKAFTIGFDESSYDEMRFADAANRKFRTEPHRYYLKPANVVAMASQIAAYYDEPFGNSSAIPAYFCAAEARQAGVSCLLAGDGGDEVLAGNSRYLDQQKYIRFSSLPALLRSALCLTIRIPILRRTSLWQKAGRFVSRAGIPLPERLEAYNFWQVDRMGQVFEPEALRQLDLEAPWRDMRLTYEGAAASDPLQRMMHLDLKQALADADLKKVTGMCELAGVDVRFPFLDDELVAFCATIPPELHLKGGRLRAFFKEAFRDFLPEEILQKKKHGFGMPFYEWTRDDQGLRELAHDSLDSLRSRDLLRRDFIDVVKREHARQEPTDYDGLVWDLMMLELWLQHHPLKTYPTAANYVA